LRGVNQDVSVDLGLPNTHLSKQEGQEAGVRAAPSSDFTFTFAVYNLWQQSETFIDPDVGADPRGLRAAAMVITRAFRVPWMMAPVI
jgi:hypothetical protein